MNGFEAYKKYVALKNHFNSPSYDYFKYGGKTKANYGSFEKRNDKHFFDILAKHKDVEKFIIANIVEDNPNVWVSQIASEQQAEHCYRKWLGRVESLTYNFKNDLDVLSDDFNKNIIVEDGQHPLLLKYVIHKKVSLETLVILNVLAKFFKYWSRNIHEDIIWPKYKILAKKYLPFITFDAEKMRKIVVDRFKDIE